MACIAICRPGYDMYAKSAVPSLHVICRCRGSRLTQQQCPVAVHVNSGFATAGQGTAPVSPPFPAAKSDAVAEAALAALAALLDAAAPQSAETLIPMLERVLRVAALPRSTSSEEVRHNM